MPTSTQEAILTLTRELSAANERQTEISRRLRAAEERLERLEESRNGSWWEMTEADEEALFDFDEDAIE